MEPTNIFFIITTVFVGVLIVLFLVISFYAWRIMRIGKEVAGTMRGLAQSLRTEGEETIKTAKKLRENAEVNKTSNRIISGVLLAAAGKLFNKKKK